MALIDILLDKDNKEPIILTDNKGRNIKFEQLAIIPIINDQKQKTIYCILKPINTGTQNFEEIPQVFHSFPNSDGTDLLLELEQNKRIAKKVLKEYKKLLKRS